MIVFTTTLFSLIFGNQAVFASSNISISLSSDLILLDILPGHSGSASQNITVSTSSIAGYTVNLQTAGQSTSLVHVDNNSLTIPTITLPTGSTSIPASSLSNNYGYSLDGGASYLPVPNISSTDTKIFENLAAGENTHTLTFGVNASSYTTAGAFTETFTIYAVANLDPCPSGYICYYGNRDDGTGTMSNQSASSNTDTTLMASNFSRPDYGFAGWNTEIDGTGTNYGPSQTINPGDLSATGLQLYAKWVPSTGNLQGWQGCSAINKGDIIALTDARDGNTYAVAKYEDEKCWMMENLRLDLSNPDVDISSLSTNKPTSDFAIAANNHPASNNGFCSTNDATCVNRIYYNSNNINRNLTASYDTNDSTSSWYSYGNYYNWYTATAGNGTYDFSTNGAAVNGDICPAGWHLPTSYGSNSDLVLLDKAIGGDGSNKTSGNAGMAASARWRAYPINYIYSGEQRGSSGYNRNISGGYTAANTTNNKERSMNFWLRTFAANFNANTNPKYRGQTIRCVASGSFSVIGNIHYNSNGGTGTMADEEDVNFANAVAANNSFIKNNFTFTGWNTKADGTGTAVAEGGFIASAANDMGIIDGGTLTLYAIWRPVYTITYDGNGADAGLMNVANEDINYDANLYTPNFSKTGYGFAGWSIDSNAADKLANGLEVKIYGPNEKILVDNNFLANADSNNQIKLYAVWIQADTTHTLQTFNSNECNALSIGDIIALADSRDNNVYAISKLVDNNCWMIENLRLDPSVATISAANTNSPTTKFVNDVSYSSTSNNLCGDNNTICIDSISFNNNNINRNLAPSVDGPGASSSWYGYGVLYNWHTATAGNGTFSMNNGNVSGDICPIGWRLPTGGQNGDFLALYNAIGGISGSRFRVYPNNFVHSGDYNQGASGGRNRYGRYWSATASSEDEAFRLGIYSSGTPTSDGYFNKWVAFAVRCMISPQS